MNRVKIAETYEGEVVRHLHGDGVLVAYDVNGNIYEQTYEKSQFIDGRLPSVGAHLIVCTTIIEIESQPERTENNEEGSPKPLEGVIEF
jgi:hypothetical protein